MLLKIIQDKWRQDSFLLQIRWLDDWVIIGSVYAFHYLADGQFGLHTSSNISESDISTDSTLVVLSAKRWPVKRHVDVIEIEPQDS